ncbi:MAG: ABC transporter permease [Leptolyngbyaceae cyanobacterium]
MSFSRVWVVATNVFKEVIRDRILYLVAVYAVLLFAAAALLPSVAASTQDKITLDLGLAGMHLLGLLVTVFVGTSLISKEIEKRTVLVLIAKPISRLEFVLGKHFGLTAVLAVLLGLLTIIYVVVLALNQIPFNGWSLAIAVLFMLLEMTLIAAAALLFSVFTSPLLATLLTLGIYLMGHLSQDIVALGKLSENAGLQKAANGIYLFLPDLERLNFRNEAIYGFALLPSSVELTSHLLYGIVYTGLLLSITVLIFARRQF